MARLTRRQFLKGAGATVASAALAKYVKPEVAKAETPEELVAGIGRKSLLLDSCPPSLGLYLPRVCLGGVYNFRIGEPGNCLRFRGEITGTTVKENGASCYEYLACGDVTEEGWGPGFSQAGLYRIFKRLYIDDVFVGHTNWTIYDHYDQWHTGLFLPPDSGSIYCGSTLDGVFYPDANTEEGA